MSENLEAKPETAEQARERFWGNYTRLAGAGADPTWFRDNIEPLIAIATQAPKHLPEPQPINQHRNYLGGGRRVFLPRNQWIEFYAGYDPAAEAVA